MASSSVQDDCISIRARVRKSHRAIDPDFDTCQEMLVSFVINNNAATATATVNNSQSKTNSIHDHQGGPSLVLTPVPSTMMTPRARSLSFSNRSISGGSRGLSPVTMSRSLPRRSFGTPTSYQRQLLGSTTERGFDDITQSDADENNNGRMMMEVSLEGDDDKQQQQSISDKSLLIASDNSNHNSKLLLGLPPTQPFTSSQHHLQQHPQQNQLLRHPSPLVMQRSSSGGASSNTNISTSYSDPQPGGSALALRSRSQSRSRSISNSRRLRSLGAAVIFANAAASSSTTLGSSGNSNHILLEQETALEGGLEPIGHHHVDPTTIPLVHVLGVDEEVPRCSSRRSDGGSGGSGGTNYSEFYSSAASDAGVAKETASAAGKPSTASGEHHHQYTLLASPPPSASHCSSSGGVGKPTHRIFLHTLSSGYLEFSLDNANSHDSFMAFLKAHLPSDRVPCRNSSIKNHGNVGTASYTSSSSAQTKQTNNVGLLRTMVLTSTKEVPGNLSGNSTTAFPTDRHTTGINNNAATTTAPSSSPPPTPTLLPSSSASVSSNRIEKLQSKMMHQRLQFEKNNRPPLVRIKERVVNWMSSAIDCGCCLDTTVAPLEMTSSSSVSGTGTGGASYKDTTPKTKALKKRGIGGLSFEVESCVSGTSSTPMPNLSFER